MGKIFKKIIVKKVQRERKKITETRWVVIKECKYDFKSSFTEYD